MLLCWHNHCIHSPAEWKPFLPFISGLPSLIAGLHFPIVQCPHCLVLTFVDSTWVLCLSLPHPIFWNFMVLHSLVEELSLAITWELEYLENYRVLLAKSYQVTFQLASFSYPLTTQNPSQHPQPWLLPAMLSYLKFHHCACLHHLASARKDFSYPLHLSILYSKLGLNISPGNISLNFLEMPTFEFPYHTVITPI